MTVPSSSDHDLLHNHYRLLAHLHDRLRHEGDPNVVLRETTRRLAEHLGVNPAGYGEFDKANFNDDQANRTFASLGEIVAVDGSDPVFPEAVLQIDLGVGRSNLVASLLVCPGPGPFGPAR
jgi:hypothetical protein